MPLDQRALLAVAGPGTTAAICIAAGLQLCGRIGPRNHCGGPSTAGAAGSECDFADRASALLKVGCQAAVAGRRVRRAVRRIAGRPGTDPPTRLSMLLAGSEGGPARGRAHRAEDRLPHAHRGSGITCADGLAWTTRWPGRASPDAGQRRFVNITVTPRLLVGSTLAQRDSPRPQLPGTRGTSRLGVPRARLSRSWTRPIFAAPCPSRLVEATVAR